jgi:uncharacterized repeat protein (TIGR03803 family)
MKTFANLTKERRPFRGLILLAALLMSCAPPALALSLTTLYSFTGPDGDGPASPLIQARDGNLYGTTQFGGPDYSAFGANGEGLIYQVNPTSPPGTVPATVFAFPSFNTNDPTPDGANPIAPVIQGLPGDDNLYGSAVNGGLGGDGTAFSVATDGTNFNLLQFFDGDLDANPIGGLLESSGGILYGTTTGNPVFSTDANGYGTLFSMTTTGANFASVPFDVASNGGEPGASLILGQDGLLYGTTWTGVNPFTGLIFSVDPTVTPLAPTVFYQMDTTAADPDGSNPTDSVFQDPFAPFDFTVTTSAGGATGNGTVDRISATGALIWGSSFNGNDGTAPNGSVILASDGNYYGTVSEAGLYDNGDIFEVTPAGAITDIYDLNTDIDEGSKPMAGLLLAMDGYLYGTTTTGGAGNLGTVFRFSLDPNLTTIAPNQATAGNAGLTITATGSNFNKDSIVTWTPTAGAGSVPLVTTYGSPTQLTAAVPANLLTTPGTAQVAVKNADGGTSGSLPFTINPAPTLATLVPSSLIVGSPAFTLLVDGAHFVNTDTVDWNGAALVTTFVSATQLSAAVPAADIATAGTAMVTAATADGVVSNAIPFTILPAPTVTSIAPNSATAGDPTFTMTVNGANFLVGDTVQWNASTLIGTVVVNAGQITVPVPAADIAIAGSATVTVVDSVGNVSNGATFTINPLHTFPAGLQIISVPYDYTGDALGGVLSLPNTVLAVWTPASSQYVLTPTAPADTLYQGHGAWVRFPQPAALISKGADLTASTNTLTIPLTAGWNLIGDPYTAAVPLSSLIVMDGAGHSYSLTQADLNGLVYNTLYGYDTASNSYQAHTTDAIQPYVGYWIDAFETCTLQIPSPNGNNPHAKR